MIIYMAMNKTNGKKYIGLTTNCLSRRISNHKERSKNKKLNYKFDNAIRKYGIDNFTFNIIYKTNSIDDLKEKEMYYIKYYDSIKNGYNMTIGGEGHRKYEIPTQDDILKMWLKSKEYFSI